jgi:hypothetical protein
VDPAIDGEADRGLRHAVGSGGLRCKRRGSKLWRRYRLHTNVQAGLSSAKTRCPVYEQAGQAVCGFNRQRRFSPTRALDSFRRRAQHRLYTNNPWTSGMKHGRRLTAIPPLPISRPTV